MTAFASVKVNKFRIWILAGDGVTVEMSCYDLTKGRITFGHKEKPAAESKGPR